jgi:hypothetical protein
VPVHVVSNRAFGAHELRLINAAGDMTLYYIYFQGAAAPRSKSGN